MKAYLVGVHCQYEGGGWDEVVLDNENTLRNAKGVLLQYLEKELGSSLDDVRDEYFKEEHGIVQDHIDSVFSIKDVVYHANSLEDLKGLSILWSDVVTIRGVEVYE